MKFNICKRLLLLLALSPLALVAWGQSTGNSKLDKILSSLPAKNGREEQLYFQELISLGDDGLSLLTTGVLPNGKEEGVRARYGVALLTHTATTAKERAILEKIYLGALSKTQDAEVKAYFISNLKLIGSEASVEALASYISDKELYDPAISAMVTIGGNAVKQTLAAALAGSSPETQVKIIKALGRLRNESALDGITKLASSANVAVKKQALWSIALLANESSYPTLLQNAKSAGFKSDPAESMVSLLEYLHQQTLKGNKPLAKQISEDILANAPDVSQQHYRLAALSNLVKADPDGSSKLLIKESTRFDSEYQKEVIKISVATAGLPAAKKLWLKEYKKATGASQADILSLLAETDNTGSTLESTVIPALSSPVKETRMAAANAVAKTRNKKYAAILLDYLLNSADESEQQVAYEAVLRVADKETGSLIAQKVPTSSNEDKIILLRLLGTRRATDHYATVSNLTSSMDAAVRSAAFEALPNVSSSANLNDLLKRLSTAANSQEISSIQSSVIASLDKSSGPAVNEAFKTDKIKILPVLPYLEDKDALAKVSSTFHNGSDTEKPVAFDALIHWQNHEAARTLLSIRKDESLKKYHAAAFEAFVNQVSKSNWPDDQKLLMLREIMSLAADSKEMSAVLRAAGNVRTFLSLVFVSQYLDDQAVSSAASRAAMQIALPTADAKPGLTGAEVRNVLQKMVNKLTGEDSQYERIDILTYLDKMPYTIGYQSIFNGKDLSGWQGLVENPIVRAKLTPDVLAKKQKEADAKVKNNWSVKDGMIVFQGDGANLCTTRKYGDFEMIVDWKISKNGDSGIYLRGSPQVQIWDTTRVDVGAQVGSGGLYNNQKAPSKPLVVADNPVGEWNTFLIRMVGEKVTVFLNGILVVDNVTLENYWDRNIPIFPEEAIELQAHGTDLAFRNIYVKELNPKPYELSKQEKTEGYQLLFNSENLDSWMGNKVDYVVEDNTIAIYPGKDSHGNLYTEKEYADFIFRFEFLLTPGANNGLGIHAPLEGDAAYVGKEIQILDNTAPIYATLQPYQYHGSVYGVLPAKRDFLKPVGEWNAEEVYVKGDYIRVTLNGTVIAEGDLKNASKNGTLDHKDHPGLNRHSGHIGFLGHGSIVKFRNLRIKELKK